MHNKYRNNILSRLINEQLLLYFCINRVEKHAILVYTDANTVG